MPASGSSAATGASEPKARSAPASSQVAPAVGGGRPLAPDAVGQVAVVHRVGRLHRGRHADRGEAGQVGVVDALGVLDARRDRQLLPGVARGLEAVERGPHGAVADRVHGHREARSRPPRGRSASSSAALTSASPEPSSIQAVPEPSAPSMNTFTGPTRTSSLPKPVRSSSAVAAAEHLDGHGHVHAQVQAPVGVEPLPQAAAAGALEVVHADDAAGIGGGHPCAHGPRELERLGRGQGERRTRRARAGRRSHAPARGRRERRRVEPQRVPVARPQRRRAIARDRVEVGGARPARPASAPAPSRARAASPCRPRRPPAAAPRPSSRSRAGRAACAPAPTPGSARARR